MPFKKNNGDYKDPNINREGRNKDPIVQKFRDAIDGTISPDEWAKEMMNLYDNAESEAVKLGILTKLAELRAPGLKLPPIDDIGDADITYTINI